MTEPTQLDGRDEKPRHGVTHGCQATADHDREVPEIDLLSTLTIRGITFRNRIVMSPMCQYAAAEGLASDWHLVHLGSRAVGGVALVMVEATAVTCAGRISPADMGIWGDQHIEPLRASPGLSAPRGQSPASSWPTRGEKPVASRPGKVGPVLHHRPAVGPLSLPARSRSMRATRFAAPLDEAGIEEIVGAFEAAARPAACGRFSGD